MNFSKIRLEGIYTTETFSYLIQKGLKNFLFDFSPRSMNFIPLHHFLDIMRSSYSSKHNYFLLFENEKEYVVSKVLEDLVDLLGVINVKNSFYLEVDEITLREIKSINQNLFLRYTDSINFSFLSNCDSNLLQGVTIDEDNLRESAEPDLFEIIGNILIEWKKISSKKCQVIIKNFSNSAVDLARSQHVDYISLVLNDEFESEYRKIDYKVVDSKLKSLQQLCKKL